jgi:excisionase family DNA binding protein
MDIQQLFRVNAASEKTKVGRTTLLAAIKRKELPVYHTGCGLPLVTLADVRKWSKQERKPGPKSASD